MSRYLSPRDIDWAVLHQSRWFLCAVGASRSNSATRDTSSRAPGWKQIVYVLGGLVLMWIASAVDYHTLLHWVPAMYAGSVVALLVTYLIGRRPMDRARWAVPWGPEFT